MAEALFRAQSLTRAVDPYQPHPGGWIQERLLYLIDGSEKEGPFKRED